MTINMLQSDDIKLTIIDKAEFNDECYVEIFVNRNFVNTIFLSFLLMKNQEFKDKQILTPREEEILTYIANGYGNIEIANFMNLSKHTIKIHIRNIFQKLDVKDRTSAVVTAIKQGLINIFKKN